MFFAAVCLAVVFASPPPPQAARLSIFVGPAVRDGFVDMDQGVADSIKDIQEELKRSPAYTVARTPSEATIVPNVVGRRITGPVAGAVNVGGGTAAGVQQPTFTRQTDRRLIDPIGL